MFLQQARYIAMDEKTAFRHELISAWCGPAFLVTFIVFWGIIGQNLPNPSPALTAEALHARYTENLGSIRLGYYRGFLFALDGPAEHSNGES